MLRKITEDDEQVTSGALNVTINIAADYQFSRLVGIKLYYDQAINRPKNNNQFNNMNFEAGVQLQLMLSQ
jgi:cell surface protein SprA